MNKYLLFLGLFALGACSSANEDLHEWMQNTRQQVKTQNVKPNETKLNIQPTYTPPVQPQMNIFDPARFKAGLQGSNAPDLNRPKQILENFSLDELHYVGLIKGEGKAPSAFIAVNGHVYTVNVGNYLGQSYGRITAITQDEIVISELVEDSYGNWTTRRTSLPLQSADNASTETSEQDD
ncbi:Tfp pilus assembly protein PilP [Snodgrassella alvi SCGC AB-598-P14]|uniref:Tfp pilus assembly protein PilP n=1 Tax=Snodgrassella alvi SCGC AB-598-J21 TaxID=1385367 RepID=A0A074V8G5_9NEIS|nr:Tfp pilus assembly protein PilP [Snodgrassella alvi SCGC AB-598-J21]KES13283.1 Tfp pilus assembly protein PilP [Snodgrassella alvi SCGC AB-598-P14]